MTASKFVLIHSPLVGPLTWVRVAKHLESRGYQVALPSLTGALADRPPYWEAIAGRVRESVEDAGLKGSLTLVAHSAAGAYLAAIQETLNRDVAATIYVDARLPNPGRSLFDSDPPEAVESIRALADERWLPPWHEWFGEAAMREVLPDSGLRREFVSELRPIPLTLFEEPIPGPAGWHEQPAGYIHFGDVYKPEARQAQEMGWPVIRLEGQHLHMLVEPAAVAEAILELLLLL
jgi:hypothetical protein